MWRDAGREFRAVRFVVQSSHRRCGLTGAVTPRPRACISVQTRPVAPAAGPGVGVGVGETEERPERSRGARSRSLASSRVCEL